MYNDRKKRTSITENGGSKRKKIEDFRAESEERKGKYCDSCNKHIEVSGASPHPLDHADVCVHEHIVRWSLSSKNLEQYNAITVHIAFLGDFARLHVLCGSNTKGHPLQFNKKNGKTNSYFL